MRNYYQLIPEKVYNCLGEIDALLRPEINGYNPDYTREIISIIAIHVQKSEGTAPLKMEYLRRLIPYPERYLAGLTDLGVIIRTGIAKKGVSCYEYCFTPEYQSIYKRLPLINAKMIRRFEKVWQGIRRDNYKLIRGHADQTRWLRQLTIDEGYSEFLETSYTEGTDQYNFILSSATRIINGDIFYSVDTTSGRFHSNVTNMAQGLRPYLRVNGEPLLNLDVKNSQPYLSTILLTDPVKVSWMTENPAFAMLLQNLKVSRNEDVIKYLSLAVSGQLYEYLMKEYAKAGIYVLNEKTYDEVRDATKKQVLRILFARNRMPKDDINRRCRQIFKDRFPTVHKIFSRVRGSSRGTKFQNFKRFAILLQRIEAYLMLDVILKRIYKEMPGVIAITIHDSIMTGILTNNVEAVRKIMIEEFTKFVGFAPKIKIEENKAILKRIEREETLLNQYDVKTSVMNN